jgi:hypothetical protein
LGVECADALAGGDDGGGAAFPATARDSAGRAEPRRARAHLDDTATALSDRSESHAIVLGNLALASIQLGDLDEAAGRLHQAIDVIELNRGAGGLNIVFKAGRELLPWRTAPVVRDAHDRLLGLMTAN